MRWSGLALGLGLAASACGGETYVLYVFTDGGVPAPPVATDPLPILGGGTADPADLYPVAASVADYADVQGANGWSYGFVRVDRAVRGEAPPSDRPLGGGGTPTAGGLSPVPGPFEALVRLEDRVPLEPGREWVPYDRLEWLYVGAEGAHPFGPVTGSGTARPELWPVRRFTAPWSGRFLLRARGLVRPEQGACPQSDGVFVSLRQGPDVLHRGHLPGPQQGAPPSWPLVPVELGVGQSVDAVVEPGTNDLCDAVSLSVEVFELFRAD